MIDWRQLQRELPDLINDIRDTLTQAVELIAGMAEKDPKRVPVPLIRILFTDDHGESAAIIVSFSVAGTIELGLSEMTEYRSGDVIRLPRPPIPPPPPTKCLLCDYIGPDLDALGLCPGCLPRPA